MKHLFVPYEIALKLKELGFGGPCLGYYPYGSKDVHVVMYLNSSEWKDRDFPMTAAPLYQQVVDWFWEKHHIHIVAELGLNPVNFYPVVKCVDGKGWHSFGHDITKWKPTIQEALTEGINYALKLIS